MRLWTVTSGTFLLLWAFIPTVLCTPDIGIRRDWFKDGGGGIISFSGVLVFDAKSDGTSPVKDLSDAQLVGLCAKAFDEMRSAGGAEMPGAMALLAIENEVYLASSIKGDRRNLLGHGNDPDQQLPQILAKAAGAARISGSFHRIGGACSEISIMDVYYRRNKRLDFSGKQARLVVWATKGSDTNIFNPCSVPRGGTAYGCQDFLQAVGSPSNPNQPLKDENLKVILKRTNRDNSWSNEWKFIYTQVRFPVFDDGGIGDDELCKLLDTLPYDGNKPDQ